MTHPHKNTLLQRINVFNKTAVLLLTLLTVGLLPNSVLATEALFTYQKPTLNIQHWALSNGARVYFVQAPQLPMLDVQVIFDAGSARDGTQFGLASLTNGLLDEGAGNLSSDEIAQRFDEAGAQFSSMATRDAATLALRTLTEKQFKNVALDTFARVINNPQFPMKSFMRQQKLALQNVKEQAQDPTSVANDNFFSLAYDDFPYGHASVGLDKTITELTPDDTKTFYTKYYVGANAVISLVGDISRDEALTIATQLVGKLPEGNPPKKLTEPMYDPKELQKHIAYPSSQTYVRIGQIGISRKDPDYFPLAVGNYSLGGGGFSSRLFKQVRVQNGFTYNINSYFLPMKTLGPFLISLQTRNETAEQAIKLTKQIVKDFVNTGLTAEEIDAAKKNIVGGFISRLDSNSAIAENLLMIGFYDLPLDYLQTYQDKIMAVTKEQVIAAFAKKVHPDHLLTITVGPSHLQKDTAIKVSEAPTPVHF